MEGFNISNHIRALLESDCCLWKENDEGRRVLGIPLTTQLLGHFDRVFLVRRPNDLLREHKIKIYNDFPLDLDSSLVQTPSITLKAKIEM